MSKLLFLFTGDWYFYLHYFPLAREVRRNGYSFIAATRVQEHDERLIAEGFKLIPISMLRINKNSLKGLTSLLELIRICKFESPDIVHHSVLITTTFSPYPVFFPLRIFNHLLTMIPYGRSHRLQSKAPSGYLLIGTK